jgi:hypothetical protein
MIPRCTPALVLSKKQGERFECVTGGRKSRARREIVPTRATDSSSGHRLVAAKLDSAAARPLLVDRVHRSGGEMTRDFTSVCEDRKICAPIIGEYLEMPGLSLTIPQACRMWNLDAGACTTAFDRLVASGFLEKFGRSYIRANDRHVAA